jgi:hypothetical protein
VKERRSEAAFLLEKEAVRQLARVDYARCNAELLTYRSSERLNRQDSDGRDQADKECVLN